MQLNGTRTATCSMMFWSRSDRPVSLNYNHDNVRFICFFCLSYFDERNEGSHRLSSNRGEKQVRADDMNGSLAHYVMWLRHKVIHMVTSDAILAGWQGLSRTLELKKDRAKSK